MLSRRGTALTTTTGSNNGHSGSNISHGHYTTRTPYQSNNDSTHSLQQRSGESNSSASIMKRVSTMFIAKKKPTQDFFGGSGMGLGVGVGYNAPSPSKKSRKKEKLVKRRESVRSYRRSSESDLEDLEEIRQPNDLGPPAPSIYSSIPPEENPPLAKQDLSQQTPKRRRRFSIHSILSSQSSAQPHSDVSSSLSKRGSVSYSSSYSHSKNSSFHSRSYSHSLHSLTQSLLAEEAELIEDPVFTATKATKVSAVWTGPNRTASAPNLVALAPSTPPAFTLSVRRKPPPRLGLRELPLPVLLRVFELLPRRLVLGLAPLSKHFLQAARLIIYGMLDLRNVSSSRQGALDDLLSTRSDLTDLTRVLVCDDHPDYLPTFPSALVLAHMNHLTTITLTCFSMDLLQHHTAFGLQSVTFLNTMLKLTEKLDLFNWLDGQINISSLSLPRLFDPTRAEIEADEESLASPAPSTPISVLNFPIRHLSHTMNSPTLAPPSPFLIPLPPSPNLIPSPNSSQIYFPSEDTLTLKSLGNSTTLLPHLKTICAPPSLLELLAPGRIQTLKSVGMNINDTLVGGLRPAELVAFLKPTEENGKVESAANDGIETLRLKFGKDVDRRTVDKVLGSVGAALGGGAPTASEPEIGRGRGTEAKNVGKEGKSTSEEHPPGLQNLEITIPWIGPRTEEVLYKTIHSVLPRYRALCTLVMQSSSPIPSEEKTLESDNACADTTPVVLSPPAVQVNGQFDPVHNIVGESEEQQSEECAPAFSPTSMTTESVETDGSTHNPRPRSTSVSQSSFASAGSKGSTVSLTMFPNPPSSIPSPEPALPVQTLKHPLTDSPKLSLSTSQSTDSPLSNNSPKHTKTLLGRLPSLKKRSSGRRADTDPPPPLPTLRGHLSPTMDRSTSLPIPKSPSRPLMVPRAAVVRDESDDEDSPPPTAIPIKTVSTTSVNIIPNTPTTPRMPPPPSPSTPKYSQFAQQQQQKQDKRISDITTSNFSVTSSVRGVDWNHTDGSIASTEPSTPVMPTTPTAGRPLSESEKKHVRLWIRQCPSLRRVIFISGSEWGV